MATKKLNIFQVLGSLGKKKPEFYDALSDDERKALHPLVIMRWLSGTSDQAQVVMLNELVNPYVFPLYHHKRLMVNLMSAAASGTGGRCSWTKAQGKKIPKTPNIVDLVKREYGYSTKDAMDVIGLLTNEDLLAIAERLGTQPDVIKLIKKELKAR